MVQLTRFSVRNFRTLGKKQELDFGSLTAIVGKNDAGKSNLFRALDLFRQNINWGTINSSLTEEYRSYWPKNRVQSDISLSGTFKITSDEISMLKREVPSGGNLLELGEVRISLMLNSPDDENLEMKTFLNFGGKAYEPGKSLSNEEKQIISGILEFIKKAFHKITPGDEKAPHESLKKLRDSPSQIATLNALREDYRDVGLVNATLDVIEQSVLFGYPSNFLCKLQDMGSGTSSSLTLILDCLRKQGKILMVEEPETGLHAAGQQVIADFLAESNQRNQVLLTTHSPIFVDTFTTDSIYLVTKDANSHNSKWTKLDTANVSILREELGLQNSHVFLPDIVVYVEGKTDLPVFQKWFQLYCTIFRSSEAAIQFLPVYGAGNVSHALEMELRDQLGKEYRFFYICDKDKGETEESVKQTIKGSLDARLGADDNRWARISPRIQVLQEGELEDYLAKSYDALARFLGKTKEEVEQEVRKYPPNKSGLAILKELSWQFRNRPYKKNESGRISEFLEKQELPANIITLFRNLSHL